MPAAKRRVLIGMLHRAWRLLLRVKSHPSIPQAIRDEAEELEREMAAILF